MDTPVKPAYDETNARRQSKSVHAAMLTQEFFAVFGNRHPQSFHGRPARDITAIDRVFPDRQPRTRAPPGFDYLGVKPRSARDPFDEIEHQGVRRLGHRISSRQNASALER